MQGIELSRRFYFELVRPFLAEAAPGLPHAATLGGYGSELLGFDDEMSRDHNWGPRLHIVVSPADFAAHAQRLVDAFSALAPATFLGEPIGWRSRPHPPARGPDAAGAANHGLELHTLRGKLRHALGIESTHGLTPAQWLGFPDQRLLAFTAGAVVHDDTGELTAARTTLARPPDDVRLYRMACQWRRIAEEQAFVGRTGMVGDDIGSRVIAARLVRDVMRMAFLLAGRYAPYPKWFGTAFKSLPLAPALTPHLEAALIAPDWQSRCDALAAAYLTLAQAQRTLGVGQTFTPVIGPYHERPFPTLNTDDIVAATLAAISDPWLSALPVIGSIDTITDHTPVLEDPATSARITSATLP